MGEKRDAAFHLRVFRYAPDRAVFSAAVNKIAFQVFEECEKEIKIFNKYSDYFGYEFFIMQKKDQDSNRL